MSMITYRYLTAEQWGIVRVESQARTERMPDPEAVLHHTAGNPRHSDDAAAVFRDMNTAAINKGYWCVAYDILVHERRHSNGDKTITIGEGRGPFMSGATKDRNEEAEAVCALGYYHPGNTLSAKPSSEMLEGIALGFVWGMAKGWISKDAKIYGHRDNPSHPGATGCPGDYLWAHLPYIKSRVIELTKESEKVHGFVLRDVNQAPRILDTRGPVDNFDAFKMGAGTTISVLVPGGVGKACAVINLTSAHSEASGFFTAWGTGPKPVSSKLNWVAGQPIANEITVELDANGSFNLYTSARTHVVIDLVGYYKQI